MEIMNMKGSAHYAVALIGLICLNLVTVVIWVASYRDYHRRDNIAVMERELTSMLHYIIDWEHLNANPLHHYMALRTGMILGALQDEDSLERPIVLYCALYRSKDTGRVRLLFEWLEEGFQSTSLEFSYQVGDSKKKMRIAFPRNAWDGRRLRRSYALEAPRRQWLSDVTITAEGIEICAAGGWAGDRPDPITLPFSIVEAPAQVAVCIDKLVKSEPVNLAVMYDLRDYITSMWPTQETMTTEGPPRSDPQQ